MDIITTIGAIASIIGAGASWRQASKARSAADEAKRVRAQLIDHRKTSELAIIQASCKNALNSMKKYGPAFTKDCSAGASPIGDSKDVQEFIFLLKEHRAYFGNRNPNEADEFCNALTPLLEDFSKSSSVEDHQRYGKQIVTHLSSIAASIKKRLDSKLDKIY
ncbi:MAG: hypothetical protein KAJ46_05560 [Sedimentisphaerales bacterium]|nr:hypothetical protein [Sedimentisphaerales bacterium]